PPVEPLRAVGGPFGRAGPWRVHANFASCPGSRGSIVPVLPRHALEGIAVCRVTGSPNLVGRRAGDDPPGHDVHHLMFLAVERRRIRSVAITSRLLPYLPLVMHGDERLAPARVRKRCVRCAGVGAVTYGEHPHAIRLLRLIERL